MLLLTLQRVTFASFLCGFSVLAAPSAPASFQGDAKALMQQGLDHLRRGEDEQALEKFRAAIATNPTNEDAIRLYREVDNAVFLRMLSKGGEFESIAKAIMAKATPALRAAKKDPAAIEALVNEALGPDFAKREQAMAKLAGEHGPYAIQGLVGPLADAGNDERRVRAMMVAVRMGTGAVPPLVTLLDSPDATLRRSAVGALNVLKDVRAMAHLALLAEKDADALVKTEARRAAMGMGWAGVEGTASDALTAESLNYLRDALDFVRPVDANDVVWDFADGKLVDAAVPTLLYGAEMSRRAALRAVETKNENVKALGALAMANSEALLLASGLGEEAQKAIGEKLAGIREELLITGPAGMGSGLTMALDGGDSRLAIEMLHAIGGSSTSGTAVPAAVMAAMGAKSRGVRIQAAVTACQIDPNQGSNAEVAKILAEGVGEKIQRVVLLVDESAERRGAFQTGFEEARWFVAPCDTGVSAVARIRRFAGADLIVLSSTIKDWSPEQVIDELKADDRTKNTPIVVLTDEKGIEGAKTRFGANAKNVLAKFDSAAMDAAIEGAPMNPERMRAEALASAAARALAHAPVWADGAREAALAACAEAAQSRADVVRIPAIHALARFGLTNQQSALAAVVADANASVPAKAAACDALAGMGMRGIALGEDGMKAAAEGLTNADASVRAAAAGAIGHAKNLDAAARAKLLGTKAVPFSASGAPATKPADGGAAAGGAAPGSGPGSSGGSN